MTNTLEHNLKIQLTLEVNVKWFETPNPSISHLETGQKRDIIRLLEYENKQWHMQSVTVAALHGVLISKHTLHNIPSDFGSDTKEELVLDCRSKAVASLIPKIQKRLLMNPVVIIEDGKPIVKWRMPAI